MNSKQRETLSGALNILFSLSATRLNHLNCGIVHLIVLAAHHTALKLLPSFTDAARKDLSSWECCHRCLTPSALHVRKSVSIHITLLAASRLVLSIYTAQQKSKNWKNFLPSHTDVDGIDGCVFFCLQRKIFLFSTVLTLTLSLFSLFPCCWFNEALSSPKRYSVLFFFHEEKPRERMENSTRVNFSLSHHFPQHQKTRSDTFKRLEGEIARFQLALFSQDELSVKTANRNARGLSPV